VNLLRARQLAEALKAPDLAEMAEELRLEGNSVVLFVNFSDTVDALCARLSCPKIDGRQNAAERQRAIDSFQADETELLVVNTAAGGTGISLHDINGDRPRVSLISPTFSAKHYLQCLGRIHRNGAKSDAVQQIVVAADSIEEHVVRSINKKIETMEMLHGN
jgi:SNF2 family DNA or RNA helicase